VGLGHELPLFPERGHQTEQDVILDRQSVASVELEHLTEKEKADTVSTLPNPVPAKERDNDRS
jgi:hypothetical protein